MAKEKVLKHVKTGDLILVKTPSIFYSAMRKLFESVYDHTLVATDNERSLHITHPKAKLMPTYTFMHPKREAIVIRVNEKFLNEKNLNEFIYEIKHNSVGKQYD